MRIKIDRLSKAFDSLSVLDDITFDVEPGQVIALLGANGAGKTTLLRLLAGILVPGGGDIYYDGQPFRRDRVDLRRRLMFMPDLPAVFPGTSIIRHIGMVLRLYERSSIGMEDKVIELLREFDVLPLAETMFRSLSRGESYKGALVALLAVDRGRTVIYSTQILEVAEQFSDRVCILHNDRIAAFYQGSRTASGRGSRPCTLG
ncbi:MAG: ATP-binding cassette domain-containing protein [Thermoguttaceae bacterium]|nr:ATP-binding cassette domain-containing protein [Thermoguttaceae bacterium]